MASKKSKNSGKPAPTRKPKKGLLPGIGGEPIQSGALSSARLDMERANRAIGKLLAEQDFESAEEMNAYLQTVLCGRKIDDIISEVEQSPEDDAQDLAYRAMEAVSPVEARSLCRKALKLDPHCIDALVLDAQLNSRSDKGYAARLLAIVREAETWFGDEYMEENRGHFWGLVETRPYMRARQTLAEALDDVGQVDEAISEYEGMLGLNPGDNQGVRDVLRGLYLQVGNTEGVRRLNKEYQESMFAVPAWSAVLERWLSGDLKQARKLAHSGHKQNPHVADYLSGKKQLPREEPGYYSPGDKNEAIVCASILGEAWRAHPEAVAWLRELNL